MFGDARNFFKEDLKMKNFFKTIYKTLFAPTSSLMVINGEYYQSMATKKYSLNNPSISMDEYMLMCDEQTR